MMGALWSRENSSTSELYVDRAVKYVTGFFQLLLGFIAVIIVHLEDGYMTPNPFVRKLTKESSTPEQMLAEQEESVRHKMQAHRESHRLTPRDDAAITLQQRIPSRDLGLSRDDTEVDYGAFYHPHDRDPNRMQREYDPLTHGVRMSVKN